MKMLIPLFPNCAVEGNETKETEAEEFVVHELGNDTNTYEI